MQMRLFIPGLVKRRHAVMSDKAGCFTYAPRAFILSSNFREALPSTVLLPNLLLLFTYFSFVLHVPHYIRFYTIRRHNFIPIVAAT